jgi:predicted PurR-regulated permease PerM
MQAIRFSPRAKVITVWILVGLTILFLYRAWPIAVPFFWALVTAYIFLPLIHMLAERTRVPRVCWIILLYLAVGALLYLAISFLIPVLVRQYGDLRDAAPAIIENVQTFIRENSRLEIFGVTLNLETVSDNVAAMLEDLVRHLPSQVLAGVGVLFGTLAKIVVYLVATFSFLLQGDRWGQGFIELLPPQAKAELQPLLRRVHVTLTAYLRGQLLLMLIMGSLSWISLTILQVRFVLILALMAAVLEVVPLLGPIAVGTAAALVSLFQPTTPFGWSNVTLAVVVVLLYTILQQLENNIIVPNLVGYMVELPPLMVIFVALAGGYMGGVLGLLLAIPIAATIRIILQYLYAKLMDRPFLFEESPNQRRGRRRRKKGKEATQ